MPEPTTLFPTDEEIRALLGMGERTWRTNIDKLERLGFPKRDPVFKKRYWPAVVAYLDGRANLDAPSQVQAAHYRDLEDFSDERPRK